jgi:hypothetical protein
VGLLHVVLKDDFSESTRKCLWIFIYATALKDGSRIKQNKKRGAKSHSQSGKQKPFSFKKEKSNTLSGACGLLPTFL